MTLPLQVCESGLGRFHGDWFGVFVRGRLLSLQGADEATAALVSA